MPGERAVEYSRRTGRFGDGEPQPQGNAVRQYLAERAPSEKVAASALYLLHEQCPCSGKTFSVAGGRMARVVTVEPRGFFASEVTPEDIRDNWATIFGPEPGELVGGMTQIGSSNDENALVHSILDEDATP